MKLAVLLATYQDGDGIGWAAEFAFLRENHAARIRTLTGEVLRQGIRTPILLGNDGRVWDGHHRLYVAYMLGFNHVPTQLARTERPTS